MNIVKRIIKKIYFISLNKTKRVKIRHGANADFCTQFEGYNIVNNNTLICNSKIGYGTYIGANSSFINTYIGRYCSIAANVKTVVATHPTSKFVSTHPAFFSVRRQARIYICR